MKAALIPPVPMLPYFGDGGFHLLLTHLLEKRAYREWYTAQRDQGAYLVLDNSAHELGEGEDAASLMAQAIKMRVQEVVVPDVLFDAEKTIAKAVHAHEVWYEAGHPGMVTLNPALMYVPQAKNIRDYVACCDVLLGLHLYAARRHSIRQNCVLGVSKDYEMWDGGILNVMGHLIPKLSHYATLGMDVKVHMLGWGRDLWALEKVRKSYPWIRSTDSAKPFVYALHDIALDEGREIPEYPKRPKRYFSLSMDAGQMGIAQRNVVVFKTVAGA